MRPFWNFSAVTLPGDLKTVILTFFKYSSAGERGGLLRFFAGVGRQDPFRAKKP